MAKQNKQTKLKNYFSGSGKAKEKKTAEGKVSSFGKNFAEAYVTKKRTSKWKSLASSTSTLSLSVLTHHSVKLCTEQGHLLPQNTNIVQKFKNRVTNQFKNTLAASPHVNYTHIDKMIKRADEMTKVLQDKQIYLEKSLEREERKTNNMKDKTEET